MVDLEKLARRNIINLQPYATARDDYSGAIGIFLDANENSLGSVIPQNSIAIPIRIKNA